jgi:ribosomal protein S18 acetylase RimI-like enzyme
MELETIKIRYAENKDFSWIKENDKCISEIVLKAKIENKEICVVESNGKKLGWLRYNLFWDFIPFMNMIYLLEEYRNKRIGTQVINYWENEMKQNGHKKVLTSTQSDEEAQHFYRKMGYTEIGGFKYNSDPFEIIFSKDLE